MCIWTWLPALCCWFSLFCLSACDFILLWQVVGVECITILQWVVIALCIQHRWYRRWDAVHSQLRCQIWVMREREREQCPTNQWERCSDLILSHGARILTQPPSACACVRVRIINNLHTANTYTIWFCRSDHFSLAFTTGATLKYGWDFCLNTFKSWLFA